MMCDKMMPAGMPAETRPPRASHFEYGTGSVAEEVLYLLYTPVEVTGSDERQKSLYPGL